MHRKLLPLVFGVLALHLAALWLLQASGSPPITTLTLPTPILIDLVVPVAPVPPVPPVPPSVPRALKTVQKPPAPAKPTPSKQPRNPAPTPAPDHALPPPAAAIAATAATVAVVQSSPASAEQTDAAPVVDATSGTVPGTVSTTAPAAAPGDQALAAAVPAAPRLELPSSTAAYLQNPKPAYPILSRRLGEQGKVVLRVLIGVDGVAHEVEITQSSGFNRLDRAALATVRQWRYVPGRRGGVPQAMWFDVPVSFVLE